MLVNSPKICYRQALENRYAFPAFNVWNLEITSALAEATALERCPVSGDAVRRSVITREPPSRLSRAFWSWEKRSLFKATPAQGPDNMAKNAVEVNGRTTEHETILIPTKLITRDNVNEYQGWTK